MTMTGLLFAVGCLFGGIIVGILVGLVLSAFCYFLNNDFDDEAVITLAFVLAVIGAVIGMGIGAVIGPNVVLIRAMGGTVV